MRRRKPQPDPFSTEAIVLAITLEYLQPFESACVTHLHTYKTYINAAMHGSEEYLTKYSLFGGDFNRALGEAAIAGHIDCVKQLVTLGATDIDTALYLVASCGQVKCFEPLIALGAKAFDSAFNVAACCGQLASLDQLAPYIENFDLALYGAAENGRLECIQKLAKLGATKFNNALQVAAQYNYPDCIRLLAKLGATAFNGALGWAAFNGHLNCIRLLVELGATEIDNSIIVAIESKNFEAVALLIKLKIDYFYLITYVNRFLRRNKHLQYYVRVFATVRARLRN